MHRRAECCTRGPQRPETDQALKAWRGHECSSERVGSRLKPRRCRHAATMPHSHNSTVDRGRLIRRASGTVNGLIPPRVAGRRSRRHTHTVRPNRPRRGGAQAENPRHTQPAHSAIEQHFEYSAKDTTGVAPGLCHPMSAERSRHAVAGSNPVRGVHHGWPHTSLRGSAGSSPAGGTS